MNTLLDYKVAVQTRGHDGANPEHLRNAINEARKDIAGERRWAWLEQVANTTVALAYDTPSESLSNILDFSYVDAVRIEIGVNRPTLTWKPLQELRDLEHDNRTPSVPMYWTEAAGQIRVWPSPDQAYTLSIDYVKKLTDLAEDSDFDQVVPDDFQSLVAWKAASMLAFRQREAWAQQYADQAYQAELKRRIHQDAIQQRQTSDQVKPYWRPVR